MRQPLLALPIALAALVAVAPGCGSGGGSGPGGGACPEGAAPLAAFSWFDAYPAPVPARRPVTLDAGYSYSYVGQPLRYTWSIKSRPAESSAAGIDGTGDEVAFTPDVAGTYEVQLVVADCRTSQPAVRSIAVEERDPVAAVPADLTLQLPAAEPVALDGSGSHDDNGDALAFRWTLDAPAGSAAALSATDQPAPTFAPDVEGLYTATLTVTANGASDTRSVAVSVFHPAVVVDLLVQEVAFSAPLDRLVVTSGYPSNALALVDPHDGTTTTVPLEWVPYALAVSPDGLTAAVSHQGHVSVVNLSDRTVTTFAAAAVDGGDLVVTGAADSVVVFPRLSHNTIQVLDLATGAVRASWDAPARYDQSGGEARPRLSRDGKYIYRLEDTGDEISRYTMPLTYMSSNTYSNSSIGAGPWLTDDGDRFLVGVGLLYSSSTLQSGAGETLRQGSEYLDLAAAAHSGAAHRFAALLDDYDHGVGELRVYDDAASPVLLETRFRPGLAGLEYDIVGPLGIFWNSGGTAFYVVVRSWDGFGVLEYAYP